MLPCRTRRSLTSLTLIAIPPLISHSALISVPAPISHSTLIPGLALISRLARRALLSSRSLWSRGPRRRRRSYVAPSN